MTRCLVTVIYVSVSMVDIRRCCCIAGPYNEHLPCPVILALHSPACSQPCPDPVNQPCSGECQKEVRLVQMSGYPVADYATH